MSATLRLYRPFRRIDGGRPPSFHIELDGRDVGTLAPRQSAEFPMEPGRRHALRLFAYRWASSPTRAFVARDGETVEFVTHPRGLWMLMVPWVLATLLVRHDLWITLEPRGRRSQRVDRGERAHANPEPAPSPAT